MHRSSMIVAHSLRLVSYPLRISTHRSRISMWAGSTNRFARGGGRGGNLDGLENVGRRWETLGDGRRRRKFVSRSVIGASTREQETVGDKSKPTEVRQYTLPNHEPRPFPNKAAEFIDGMREKFSKPSFSSEATEPLGPEATPPEPAPGVK